MTKNPIDATSTDFASITSNYQYKTSGNTTTNLISCLNNTITGEETNTVNYSYTYDSNGKITNISTVSSVPNLSGASQYIYDGAGQLVREVAGSTTYEYAYDLKGNISSRKTYSNDTLTKTDTFTYGATGWEDRLTGYKNKTIAYDEIGNPTSYLGATLTWRGRELAGYEKGNKQISYSYDVDGMRYRKIVETNGNETARYDYVYSDGKLILLTYTANGVSNTARFIYDSWGEPRGFILNNTAAYIYLKNAQGDITAIVDENGEVLLTYSYTAWGKVTYSATSMENLALAATLSNVNPFTYRGYCYDYDIGMYYLQSRYYDPEICRFINADSTDYLGAFKNDTKYLKCVKDILYETVTGYNLFSYCENDCVNGKDYTGYKSQKNDNPKTLEKYLKKNWYNTRKTEWGNDRVSVKIKENDVTISVNFNISGSLAQKKIAKKTYKSLFLSAIKDYWKGSFKVYGYNITLRIKVKEADKKYVKVNLVDKIGVSNTAVGFWRAGKNCPITIYKGDSRKDKTPNDSINGYVYSSKEFSWVCAHEFGHVLGTWDVSRDETKSIMGKMGAKLTGKDIERVIKAFKQNAMQYYW